MAYTLGRPGEGEHAGAIVLDPGADRVSWGAIFAGALAALGVQIFFTLVGLALGFAWPSLTGAAGWWWFGTGIASLFAGGFVAGRLAGVPLPTSAVLNGAVVWAIVTVLSAAAAIAATGALIGGAASLASSAGQAAATVAQQAARMAPEDLPEILPPEIADRLETALEDRDLTAEDIRAEARSIYDAVISQREEAQAREALREALVDVVRSPGDIGGDLQRLIDRLVGAGGVLGEEDEQALVAELESRFDLSEEEATQLAQAWAEQLRQAAEQVEQATEEARRAVAEAADEAQEAAAGAATAAAIATFLALFAACAGALLGRPEGLIPDEIEARRRAA